MNNSLSTFVQSQVAIQWIFVFSPHPPGYFVVFLYTVYVGSATWPGRQLYAVGDMLCRLYPHLTLPPTSLLSCSCGKSSTLDSTLMATTQGPLITTMCEQDGRNELQLLELCREGHISALEYLLSTYWLDPGHPQGPATACNRGEMLSVH